MSRVQQPEKKPCPKCGHLYRVTISCKNCGAYLGEPSGAGKLFKTVGLGILAFLLLFFIIPFFL